MREGRGGAALRESRLPQWLVVSFFLASTVALAHAGSGQFVGARPGVLVSGSVSDDRGNPVSVARVALEDSVGDFVQSSVTDSSGSFFFTNVRTGNYQIVINASGYEPGSWPVQVGFSPVIGLTFNVTSLPSSSDSEENSPGRASTVSVNELLIPKKARKEFEKGMASEARGKTNEAIEHWKTSIKIYPRYAESYMELSWVYAHRGKSDLATKAAGEAVALDGTNPVAYNYLGYAYARAGKVPQAEAAFEKAVGISNTDWFGHFALGQLLYQQHDAQGAYPHLLAASQLRPQVPEVHILLYNDLLVLGRKRAALAQLDYFLKTFPKDPMTGTVQKTREILEKSLADNTH